MKLRLLALRAGLFNVSKNIKYTIFINKANSYVRHHSEFENIYLEVEEAQAKETTFDFFQQVPPDAFKKQQQEESLI